MAELPLEVQRLCELPVEKPLKGHKYVETYSRKYSVTPYAPSMTLRPIQAQMLAEAKRAGGLVAMVACGEGKTLTSLLLPSVLNAQRPLILLPASMRAQYESDRVAYGEHFNLVPMPCMSYEGLSSPAQVDKLNELDPDLIICDEAHHLKNLKSARVKRLETYLLGSGAMFCALSGTLVSRSLREYAHLCNWALGPWSPLPRENHLIHVWAKVIEDGDASRKERKMYAPSGERFDENPEKALHKRLRSSRGVVITKSQDVGASLLLETRRFRLSPDLRTSIATLLESQDVVSATHEHLSADTLQAVMSSSDLWTPQDSVYSRAWPQLLMGFVYIWEWGDRAPDTEWIEARRAWSSAVNWALERYPVDSEALLKRALQRQEITHPRLVNAWNGWSAVNHREPPTTRAVWVEDTWVKDIVSWAEEQKDPPLIWCGLQAVADRIAEMTGYAVYGGGDDASKRLDANKHTAHPAVISISSHGTGKNLQSWGNQIVAHPLAHPARWEQMLARTHRAGQQRDEVRCVVYRHSLFGRALNKAKESARYVFETTGQNQRLLYCTKN